jgi:bis(5'-nucleosyl)-tetraphosphatase (symmetrical)
MTDNRKILIGDVHGCFDELMDLMNILSPTIDDRLIFLGDLIDRGPKSREVVRFVMDIEGECVLGNHEEKFVRYMAHEAKRAEDPLYKNPMRPRSDLSCFSEKELSWLAGLPAYLTFKHGERPWIAVHAGFTSDLPWAEQSRNAVTRVRYLKPDSGKSVGRAFDIPPGSVYWTERWKGPASVVYGHNVHDLQNSRIDRPVPDVLCLGIDTGCCFGGSLTAAVFLPGDTEPMFVAVDAKKDYCPRKSPWTLAENT